MQNKVRLVAFATLFLTIAFTACKKNDDTSSTPSSNSLTDTQVQTHNDDQSRVGGEVDAIANDANLAVEGSAGFGGRLDGASGVQTLICGATTVVDTVSNPRTITVTYNGLNCTQTETRTGTVVFSLPQGKHWRDSGAVLTVQITNLKITRVRDNKSITINGTHLITNVSGGKLSELPNLGRPIIHTVTSSNMSVTFDDNTQRTWQVARQRTFTYNNGVVITTTGLHTEGATSGITEWGTTRFGTSFATAIKQPLVIREDCSFRLVSGQLQHSGAFGSADVTFGLDVSGNPVSCPSGTYFMKIVITRTGQSPVTAILPY